MIKNYDELIDLIHKNDKKIESFLNILTKKLKALEGVLWKDYNIDVDHLNLTLALANRQVYANKLYDSKEFETKEEPPIKRGRNSCELIERRKKYLLDLTHFYKNTSGMDREYARAMIDSNKNELQFIKRLKNILFED
ncbi:MAG: hypothetical protein QN834_07140 [Nitrososphaeraceae archaeon]|nr:hypothetical protein [Nitrososphaeraceae archaeon]